MDENDFMDLGFMFDAHRSRTTKSITINRFEVLLKCIDEEPGHVQSGQHLWPGAYQLSNYCKYL